MEPMASAVAQEAVEADAGADNAAGFVFAFDQEVILAQMQRAGEARESRADDEHRLLLRRSHSLFNSGGAYSYKQDAQGGG